MKHAIKTLVLAFFLITSNAQADISGCLDALEKSVYLNQTAADRLSNAIMRTDIKQVKELAKPWLNIKNHEYTFGSDGGFLKTNDILLFAAIVAANEWYSHNTINSLKTLVEMGFKISTTKLSNKKEWGYFFQSYLASDERDEIQEQTLVILLDAGLTAEKLYLEEYQSPVHQSLLTSDQDKFKTIFNSGLITKNNINLQFKPDTDRNARTTLLQWHSLQGNKAIVKLLIKKGAVPKFVMDKSSRDAVTNKTLFETTPSEIQQELNLALGK